MPDGVMPNLLYITSIVRPAVAGRACKFIVEVEDVFFASEAIPKVLKA